MLLELGRLRGHFSKFKNTYCEKTTCPAQQVLTLLQNKQKLIFCWRILLQTQDPITFTILTCRYCLDTLCSIPSPRTSSRTSFVRLFQNHDISDPRTVGIAGVLRVPNKHLTAFQYNGIGAVDTAKLYKLHSRREKILADISLPPSHAIIAACTYTRHRNAADSGV